MARTRAPGQQLTIDWETSTEHVTQQSTTDLPKEEHFLRHRYQGNTSYCALYAIAILEDLDIEHVIKTAKRQCSILRKRSRYSGRFWQIHATYKALGYVFPFDMHKDKGSRRIKNATPAIFTGRGHARLSKRKHSTEGHQVCFQDGTVYDPAKRDEQTAAQFLETTKYVWIVIRKSK